MHVETQADILYVDGATLTISEQLIEVTFAIKYLKLKKIVAMKR